VVHCPVGALVPKHYQFPETEVASICPYCATGCGIFLGISDGKLTGVSGRREGSVNRGNLCVKGRFGATAFVQHPDRLQQPYIKKDGQMVKASWDEALGMVAQKLAGYKPGEVAVVSSARCTNEENYLAQKLARAVLGTNNVDHCARI
jgi:predicted molibdopterin-dependent oxidoreductase YjgC